MIFFISQSSLSLVVVILSKYPVTSAVNITVSYKSFAAFDPYWFNGYAGKLKRFSDAKDILDDQVTILPNYIVWCFTIVLPIEP